MSASQSHSTHPIAESDVIGVLSDLVAIPSANPQHAIDLLPPFGENGVACYVEEFGRSLGLQVERQIVLPGRDNVILTLAGADPTRALLLECHMDTVPGWDGNPDPYVPRLIDGQLYGRGACDVKGTLAAMLLTLRAIVRGGRTPARSLILAAVVDEEHQARGVVHLTKNGPTAEAAIVGEPTGLAIAIAHKGCVRWRVATWGRSAHSSKAQLGVNAIDTMVMLLADLKVRAEGSVGRSNHPLVGRPSLSVCTIHGGVAVNVIPDHCEVEIDRRTIPGESLAGVIAEFESIVRDIAEKRRIDVTIEPPFVVDPALGTDPEAEIVVELARASTRVLGSARVIGVPFGTDGSKLSNAGIPTVVFGPGSIDVAHTIDEHVSIAEVARAVSILVALVLDD